MAILSSDFAQALEKISGFSIFGFVMKRFGEKLRLLRERRGLSYRQLGSELGYSYAHFARIESGVGMPSAELIVAIAKYFGVSFDELMDDDVDLDL